MKMVLAIEPKAQSRPRFSRQGVAFEDKKMKSWRRACRDLVKLGYRGQRLADPVRVKVTFYVPVPQYIRRLKYLDEALQEERIYRDKLPKFNNGGAMVLNHAPWEKDSSYPIIHPTQKPIPVLKRLIEIFTDEGDVVIDPVAGSGSTLRAAIEMNRSAYGFEIKKEFYRAAKEHMLSTFQTSLF